MGSKDIEAVPLLENPNHAKQSEVPRRSPLNVGIWAFVILVSFAVLSFAFSFKQSRSDNNVLGFQSKNLSPQQSTSAQDFLVQSQSLLQLHFEISNEYGPSVQSLEYYPWDYLAEPYKTSTLSVNSPQPDVKYKWTITLNDDPSYQTDFSANDDQASEISAIFTKAGKMYTVKVVEEGGANRSFEAGVICKYVRREIRVLNNEDRVNFLDALYIFYTTPLEEGRAKYGERFINSKKITLKHIQQYTTPDGSACSPWHHGMTFVTNHMAFALWVEQALQAINPTIALPYWDYVKDTEEYGANFEFSEIFTDEYMGVYQTYPFPTSGRWKDIQVSMVESESDKYHTRFNAYGVITDWYNNNNQTMLHRGNMLCGMKTSILTMPGCDDLHQLLKAYSFESAYDAFELDIHSGGLHTLLGGIWDCQENFAEVMAKYPGNDTNSYYFRYYMEKFLFIAQATWDNAWYMGYYNGSAPPTCDPSTPFSECRYYCTDVGSVDDLTDAEVYDFLVNKNFLAKFSSYLTYANTSSGNYSFETNSSFVFENVDHETDLELKRHLLILYCNPGKMSQFSSPLGSPDDPLFHIIHSYFAIFWDYLLLTKDTDFSLEWTDATTCLGHSVHDTLPQEYFGFLGEAQNKEHDLTYTNFDLIKIFHPTNPNLPYLHAEFSWDYCKIADLTDTQQKPEMYKGQVNITDSVP